MAKKPKKIHERENVRKKIHVQDGPHFDIYFVNVLLWPLKE